MVKRRATDPPPNFHYGLRVSLKIIALATLLGGMVIGALVWLLPVEVMQSWAFDRTEGDGYKKFEAVGRAEALCWLLRFTAPALAVASIYLLRNLSQTAGFLSDAFAGWIEVTRGDPNRVPRNWWQSLIMRGFFLAWSVLALGHSGHAMMNCMTNWSYYRFRSGSDVLPNISDSNRAVIRYLLQSTPSNARIFVASDQKLYFLSYYLLPRRLYYKSHPDSEFVIALPDQQRRMAAYRLSEIDGKSIERIAPDYILEYFEHPDFVDRARSHDDPVWLAFFRQMRHDPLIEPSFLVCLRRVEKDDVR